MMGHGMSLPEAFLHYIMQMAPNTILSNIPAPRCNPPSYVKITSRTLWADYEGLIKSKLANGLARIMHLLTAAAICRDASHAIQCMTIPGGAGVVFIFR